MTIQQLEAFVAVCETNNFAKAAKNLNMYPSNLSYTITEFENSLDVLLLNRSKKGVYPNILGQEVYTRAKKILDFVSSCMENADTMTQNRKGFTLTYSRQFSLASFQSGLKELHKEFSDHGVSLDLIIPNDQTMAYHALITKRADMAILYEDVFEPAEYQKSWVANDALYVALSSSHRLASRRSLSLNDIKDQTILLCQDGNLWDEYVKELFFRSNMTPSKFTYCYNSLLQKELIIQHPHYVSVVSSLSVPNVVWNASNSSNSLNDTVSDLVYLPLNHEINQRKVYAVYSDDVENPEMIESVLHFVCK